MKNKMNKEILDKIEIKGDIKLILRDMLMKDPNKRLSIH